MLKKTKRFSVCKHFFLSAYLALCGCALFPSFYAFDEKNAFERGVAAFDEGAYGVALNELRKPAEDGNPDAQYLSGLIYLNGLNGKTDFKSAELWLSKAANAGHFPAQVQLAYLYKNADFPLYDPAEAYYWFSVICESVPGYEAEMNNLNWTVVDRRPKRKLLVPARTDTVNYNSLFPAR